MDYPTYLVHFGIKGQRWGNRRYQNEDGTLTPEGKIRYGYDKNTGKMSKAGLEQMKKDRKFTKQYMKLRNGVFKDFERDYTSNYVKAYNKSADFMNKRGISEYNKEQEKKYGKDFAKRPGYESDYMKRFNKLLDKNMKSVEDEWYYNNSNIRKAAQLIKKYGEDYVEDKNDIKMFKKYKML